MANLLRIHVSCEDGRGLLAAVASCIFDHGGDLGDATFTRLGEQAEFMAVGEFPDHVEADEVQRALRDVPALEDGEVSVTPFGRDRASVTDGSVTHVVRVRGVDRPGLMARLAEAFGESGANIVRMDAEHRELDQRSDYHMRFEIHVAPDRAEACLASVSNTAETMSLHFQAEPAENAG